MLEKENVFVFKSTASALALRAVASAVLSDGCPARLAKLTLLPWLICSNHTAQSYMYRSQTSTSSVSTVVEAVPVYCTPFGL